jgi:two-component system, chemotaxis family, protein-glutamate methylesterase/glutaminase
VTTPPATPIRVLLADDSPTARHYLTALLGATPSLRVVGEARNGAEAVTLAAQLQPDVIAMDIQMPQMDGLEATRQIMSSTPMPIVIVSGVLDSDVELSLQALQAGALAVIEKPPARDHAQYDEKAQRLTTTLAAMSQVKVISRRTIGTARLALPATSTLRPPVALVAIGASAGGPSALSVLLGQLPASLSVPLVVVQHIADEFIGGLARWLSRNTPLSVQVAADGMPIVAGQVYLAPGRAHLQVRKHNGGLICHLQTDLGQHRHCPSVDVLMHSVAATCGAGGMGIVLTGMGVDGADGLLALRHAGGRTVAQDQASSTVFGMPSACIHNGAAEQVLPLAKISATILNLV